MKTTLILLFFTWVATYSQAQKRIVDVDAFSQLVIGIPGNIYLAQGDEEKVEIESTNEQFEKIQFKQREDKLIISSKLRNRGQLASVDIYLTLKELNFLHNKSSGNIKGQSQFQAKSLRLDMSGSGNIWLEIESTEIKLVVSGSGKITLKGISDKAEVSISSQGIVNAGELRTRQLEASLSGTGNCHLSVVESIHASISNEGSIYYTGNPVITGTISGAGGVKRVN